MLNYHELTMHEPRDSPARKKQHAVITILGLALLSAGFINGGILFPIVFEETVYPGGEYVYKPMVKDYATSWGVSGLMSDDLGLAAKDWDDLFYTVYLDNGDVRLPGGEHRFFAGILIDESQKDLKTKLLSKNTEVCTLVDKEKCQDQFYQTNYEVGKLPSVKATAVQFPFSNGLFSAILLDFKVLPALKKHAKEIIGDDKPIIITSTCGMETQMCVHYVPHVDTEKFLLGHPDSATYKESLPPQNCILWDLICF